jgi:hypothetical protein
VVAVADAVADAVAGDADTTDAVAAVAVASVLLFPTTMWRVDRC